MTSVDTATIVVSGGHGGAGAVSFRKEKFAPKGGPDGGDGGHGGSVLIQADSNRQTLMDLRLKTAYHAQNGEPGRPKNQFGSAGRDLIIPVPCGTLIYHDQANYEPVLLADLTTDRAQVCVARGKGGQGNPHFASPKYRTPRYAQPGLPGESLTIRLAVKLIANIGLVGLPNAGKSTLLNALTGCNSKVAAYPFSTIRPNLGVMTYYDRTQIIADIPGLLDGAHAGVGLGNDFLRHVDRTHTLVHLVSMALTEPEAALANYRTIMSELGSRATDDKQCITVLSQADVVPTDYHDRYEALFHAHGIQAMCISAVTGLGLSKLKQVLCQAV